MLLHKSSFRERAVACNVGWKGGGSDTVPRDMQHSGKAGRLAMVTLKQVEKPREES